VGLAVAGKMGYDRGGWHSWDRVDHGGMPSADRIVPQWQNLAEGQRLNSMGAGRELDDRGGPAPNGTLVLRSSYQLPSVRAPEPHRSSTDVGATLFILD